MIIMHINDARHSCPDSCLPLTSVGLLMHHPRNLSWVPSAPGVWSGHPPKKKKKKQIIVKPQRSIQKRSGESGYWWISWLLMPRCINKFRLANDTIAILVKLLKGCNHITGRHGSQWYRIELPVGRPFEVQVCNEIKYIQNGRSTCCSISGVFMNYEQSVTISVKTIAHVYA